MTSTSRCSELRFPTSAELFGRLRDHDDAWAREQLIERFLPLARKLAARYRRSGEPYEDLVQVASVGLVNAVDRFDPDRGYAFTSFAVPTIVGELKRYFRDLGWGLHVERRAQERARAVAEADAAIRARTGRAPSVNELAQYLEFEADEVLDGLKATAARDPVSLDAPSAPGGRAQTKANPAEMVGELDQRLGLADDLITVHEAASHLPKLERDVLYLRFGADLTQAQIATRVGVSQMQVSRLLRRSLGRLREQLSAPDVTV